METKLNSNFSFARLWKYTWANIYINRKTLMLGSAAAVVSLIALYMWLSTTDSYPAANEVNLLINKLLFVFTGIFFISIGIWLLSNANLFADYHNKGTVGRNYLLPVSQNEQWMSRILYSWIGLILTFLLQFIVLFLSLVVIDKWDLFITNLGYWNQSGWLGNLHEPRYLIMLFYSWSVFLCVGTFFARKRIAFSLLAWALLSYLISSGVSSFYNHFYWNGDVSLDYAYALQRIVSIIQAILAVGFVSLSYIRFKRLQINR